MEDKEKILWIYSANMISGTIDNFIYNISELLPLNASNINVQLIKAVVPISGATYFNNYYLKVMIDWGSSSNQLSQQYNGYLLMDVISFSKNATRTYRSEYNKLNGIEYKLNNLPNNLINVRLLDNTNTTPAFFSGAALIDFALCIKFEYNI